MLSEVLTPINCYWYFLFKSFVYFEFIWHGDNETDKTTTRSSKADSMLPYLSHVIMLICFLSFYFSNSTLFVDNFFNLSQKVWSSFINYTEIHNRLWNEKLITIDHEVN